MMSVDFTPMELNKPIDASTESITTTTPDKPSITWGTLYLLIKKSKLHAQQKLNTWPLLRRKTRTRSPPSR